LLNGNRLSDIFDSPRKSFRLFTFFNQATWLVLALEMLFWRVTGTIVGTVLAGVDANPMMTNAPIATSIVATPGM
jgi:hypothetical protein